MDENKARTSRGGYGEGGRGHVDEGGIGGAGGAAAGCDAGRGGAGGYTRRGCAPRGDAAATESGRCDPCDAELARPRGDDDGARDGDARCLRTGGSGAERHHKHHESVPIDAVPPPHRAQGPLTMVIVLSTSGRNDGRGRWATRNLCRQYRAAAIFS